MVNNPLFVNGLVDGIFHIAKNQMPELAAQYVSEMETQRTNDWCKCEWIIHPDDVDLDIYNCGNCHHPRALHRPGADSPCTKSGDEYHFMEDCYCDTWVDPPKRRMRRGDTHSECAVHTKEGFLLGFFEWMFKDEAWPPKTCRIGTCPNKADPSFNGFCSATHQSTELYKPTTNFPDAKKAE